MTYSLSIKSASASIAGVKPQNEDACGIYIPEGPLLSTKGIAAVIADGMSGSDAGKEASQACVNGFLEDYFSTPESWAVKTSARKILSALNHWLHGQGRRKYDSHKGMVTTLTAMVLKSNTGYIFHVGDTRIYRLRDNDFEQLTRDHRVTVNEKKTYLSRAMGIELHLDIDYRSLSLEIGDVFVMLTDGVYEFINDQNIKNCLKNHPQDLKAACDSIVQQALTNKSNDNLSCQIFRIEQLPTENKNEFYDRLIELPFPPPLQAGMILDGYKILRHLFSNKRTEVYLTQDSETDESVVLKAPSINYEDDPDFIHHFLHEEWAGRRISNPHVMKVLEIKRRRTALYYICEYIEGRTLRQWMDDEPRQSLSRMRNFIEQIAQGLRAFHRMEMIHQDLKPENILVDEHGTLKIIDFGSTKIAGIEEISTPLETNNLLGTINYTAPEYHIGEQASNRSDIFSLGVIAYELLSGKLPYGKELSARNLRRVNYRSIKQFNPEVPVWVDRALEKSVHIKPEYRFSILSEFTHALNRANSDLVHQDYVPLLSRNPLQVWRGISAILLLSNLLLLYLYLR